MRMFEIKIKIRNTANTEIGDFWEILEVPETLLPLIKKLIGCMELLAKKNHDYSETATWYSNFIKGGLAGCYNLMQIKFKRLKNLLQRKSKPKVDESLEDICMDIANYAIIISELNNVEEMTLLGEWEKEDVV